MDDTLPLLRDGPALRLPALRSGSMPLRLLGTMPDSWWQGMAQGGWRKGGSEAPAVCGVGAHSFSTLRDAAAEPTVKAVLWLGVPAGSVAQDGLDALELLGFSPSVALWQPLRAVLGDSRYRFPHGRLGLDVLEEAMPGLAGWVPTRIGPPPERMPASGVMDVVAVRCPDLERGLRFAAALTAPMLEQTAQLRVDALFITKYVSMVEQTMAVLQTPASSGQGS
ncbi:hypothetical protein [Azospirillum lipoferum]|uniref:Uncharacterized protein n=1 Tax=Azospirillum lipoferum (strain 4B) TaxID=862719 RepID=G7ZJ02_AZOL4|nr:hypothetical protein [Azospirillum lipoferum]CBS91516.1 protein of unknown function [Azospirillum lipoferum 4B]